ncbi:hypothetical protein L596_011665 [Steinernema carpocapsae]|uniref:Uncharacterized protein n=1 Tax=Steinernema carpocapsae TaxID=34508 RepID=A0A4U5NVE2_STECR|nr:hypothetical protein L596_011665 [Steinernema carpocapsae]
MNTKPFEGTPISEKDSLKKLIPIVSKQLARQAIPALGAVESTYAFSTILARFKLLSKLRMLWYQNSKKKSGRRIPHPTTSSRSHPRKHAWRILDFPSTIQELLCENVRTKRLYQIDIPKKSNLSTDFEFFKAIFDRWRNSGGMKAVNILAPCAVIPKQVNEYTRDVASDPRPTDLCGGLKAKSRT